MNKREKLEMGLEKERKSHKERDQRIKEQQMKIKNLGTRATSSDRDSHGSSSQNAGKQSLKEGFIGSNSVVQEDVFVAPTFKAVSSALDTWLKMNKGFNADLELIQSK